MGFGAASYERWALELTYEDTAAINRMVSSTEGAIDRQIPAVVYAGIPCALSRSGDRSKQTQVQHDIEYDCVLFAAPELLVEPGDTVEVSRFGRCYTFEAVGSPAIYATHQEIFLKGRDLA